MEGIHTDVEILLECVKCQLSEPSSLNSTLVTLASVLTSNEPAKEHFRDLGGLKYVFNLILRTEDPSIKQSGLFCLACAVEKSVFAQKCLSQQSSFGFVHNILSDEISTTKMKQTAVFFLLCLVANNGLGQNLARQTGCLVDLMEMCKALIRENQSSLIAGNAWTIVNSGISVCVNNPQNEENQHISSTLFPHLFKLIQDHLNPELLKPALSLIGLAVANNVLNQDRVRRCGGLDTLVNSFGKCMGYSILDEPGLAIPIISTLDSCIADHEANCLRFAELGGINLLLETLRQPQLDQQENLQVILTLGHTLDTSAENQSYVDRRGYQTLVKLLTEAQDEELIKAIKYTLNLCQKEGQTNRHFIADSGVENSERQQGGLILEKISELTAKLNSFEEESRQEAKLLSDLVENQNKKSEAEKCLSRPQLLEETQVCKKNLEDSNTSKTETLLQQLLGLFGSSQTLEKPCGTTSNVHANWQDDQYTPVKNIQIDTCNPNISSHKLSCSTRNTDNSVRMINDNMTFESKQRKSQIQNYTECINNNILDSVNLSKGIVDNHACNQYNLTNDDARTLGHMERHIPETSQTQHFNKTDIINTSTHSYPFNNCHNFNRSKVNSSDCLHSDTYYQNRDPLQMTNNDSSNSMAVNGNGVPSYSNTRDVHLSDNQTTCQCSMHNQRKCSDVDIFGHNKSCNCYEKNNQFQKSNQDGNFNESIRIMCQNVNENNRNLRGHNTNTCTNHTFVCKGKDHDLRFNKSCTNSNSEIDEILHNLYYDSYKMGYQESHNCMLDKEKSVNCPHNQVHCGYSKPETQGTNMGSKNMFSACHAESSNTQSSMDNAQQNILQNNCSSHRKLDHMSSQKEQCKNMSRRLVILRNEDDKLCEDDDKWDQSSESSKLLSQKDTTHKSDMGSNAPIDRITSNSLLNKRQCGNHTNTRQDGNEDSECDIFLTEKDDSTSGYSLNKIAYSQPKKSKCLTPKVRCVYEKERSKIVDRSSNKNIIQSEEVSTDKYGSEPEQEHVHTSKLQQRIYSTEEHCHTISENLKTCSVVKNTFLKPSAVPLRRKIMTPSSCGSSISSAGRRNNVRVLSKMPTVGIQVKPVTKYKSMNRSIMDSPVKLNQVIQPPPSPVMSEFDFSLFRSAKRNVWQFDELSGPCTPIVQRLSVKKFRSFTDVICRKKLTHNPAHSRPVSEQCLDYSDNESFSSSESESTEGSQKSSVESETNSAASRRHTMKKKNSLCPGCNSSEEINGAILNSRTFNIALETSINTCSSHRNMRRLERNFILKTKESKYAALTASKKQRPLRSSIKEWIHKQKLNINERKKPQNVYDFPGSSSDSEPTISKLYVSPPHSAESSIHPIQKYKNKMVKRRRRIPYSQKELAFLKHGVENLGKKWNQILVTYKFDPSRTAVDLMEKYKRLKVNKNKKSVRGKCSKLFSMCEERRLMRGVKTFGYNWKGILHAFKFSKEKSAEDLRNKWRSLNRN